MLRWIMKHEQFTVNKQSPGIKEPPGRLRITRNPYCTKLGGEGGIRTLGESPHDGFQDRYHQPLGHLSKESTWAILTD